MKKYIRTICFMLVTLYIVALPVNATEISPRGNSYIVSYSARAAKTSDTTFAVWFSVVGTGTQEEIGAFSITVQRSKDNATWSEVYTYYASDFPQMYAENTAMHSGNMICTGEKGYYYRASVIVYAKKDNGMGMSTIVTGSVYLPNTGRSA